MLSGILLSLAVQLISLLASLSWAEYLCMAAMIMHAVCRHTDKSSGLTQEGAGPCCPHRLPGPGPSPPSCPPTVSLLPPRLCLPRGSPHSVHIRPELLRADAQAQSLSLRLSVSNIRSRSARSSLSLASLPLFSSSSLPGTREEHSPPQFSWLSADMGATPALCQDFPLAREPTSPSPPRTASTQVRHE